MLVLCLAGQAHAEPVFGVCARRARLGTPPDAFQKAYSDLHKRLQYSLQQAMHNINS